MLREKNTRQNNQPNINEMVLRLCAHLLLVCIFVGQNVIALPSFSFNLNNSQNKNSTIDQSQFVAIDFSNAIHNFSHFPFGSDPNKTETPLENDIEESIDDELKDWVSLTSFIEKLKQSNNKASSASFILSLNKRKVIPLFVLQHSWRAFLS